jgi:hypothetical protein
LDVKGGIPSPLHNPPMRVYAMPHWFVYSLRLRGLLPRSLFLRWDLEIQRLRRALTMP